MNDDLYLMNSLQHVESWKITASLTILFTLIRYMFQDGVQRLLNKYPTFVPEEKRIKFSESSWKFLYYSIVWTWSTQVVLSEDFFWNTKLCWLGWPNIPMSESFRLFYLTQLAFYIHSFIAHVTIEVRRKDYWEMFIHHIISFLLIGASLYHGVFRIGGVLLALHDLNDVLLEAAKMCEYSNNMFLGHTFFVLLVVCWLVTRIVLFPIKILYSSSMDVFSIRGELPPEWYFFFGLLLMVQALNIFWFGLMIKIIYSKIFKNNKIKDVRED